MSNKSDKPIRFFFLSKNLSIKERGKLKRFLQNLAKQEGKKPIAINYIFCTDQYLLKINRQYLKHDYYTDIITFDLSSGSVCLEADIYISTDRIRDNAKKMKTTLREELHRVIFHGLLHLCGYSDKRKNEIEEMRKMENYYIQKFFSQ